MLSFKHHALVLTFLANVLCLQQACSAFASGAVPSLITVQGRLTDSSNNPLPPGPKSFAFSIFNDSTLGIQIWPPGLPEVQSIVSGADGLWIGALGAVNPLTYFVFSDSARWLEITVDGTTLPRTRLTTSSYAFRVATVDGASGGLINGTLVVSGKLGIGTNPTDELEVKGVGAGSLRFNTTAMLGMGSNSDGFETNVVGGVPDGFDMGGQIRLGGSARGDADVNVIQFMQNGIQRMRISDGGSVSIGGTVTPSARLVVDGPGDAGIASYCSGYDGNGIIGSANVGPDAYGVWGLSSSGYAGVFSGNVSVINTLFKGAGAFKIDHPLDPANKSLYHSFVESPDMKNIYDGIVTTDAEGNASVTLPDWFGALNRDFCYQLTVVGQFAQAIISQKIENNKFSIKTDKPNVEVSWQVTGIRQDAYANAHRIPVEEVKGPKEQGFYLHPELVNQPEEKGVEWLRHPELMKSLKQQRDNAKTGIDQ